MASLKSTKTAQKKGDPGDKSKMVANAKFTKALKSQMSRPNRPTLHQITKELVQNAKSAEEVWGDLNTSTKEREDQSRRVRLEAIAAQKKSRTVKLLEKVLGASNIVSEKGMQDFHTQTRTSSDKIMSFPQEGLRLLKEDVQNFSAVGDHVAHLDSKLGWLLQEIGDMEERIHTTTERNKALEVDIDVMEKGLTFSQMKLGLLRTQNVKAEQAFEEEKHELKTRIQQLQDKLGLLTNRHGGKYSPRIQGSPTSIGGRTFTEDQLQTRITELEAENAGLRATLHETKERQFYDEITEVNPRKERQAERFLETIRDIQAKLVKSEEAYERLEVSSNKELNKLRAKCKTLEIESKAMGVNDWKEKVETINHLRLENEALSSRYKAIEEMVLTCLTRLGVLQSICLSGPSSFQVLSQIRNAKNNRMQNRFRRDSQINSLVDVCSESFEGPDAMIRNAVLQIVEGSEAIQNIVTKERLATVKGKIVEDWAQLQAKPIQPNLEDYDPQEKKFKPTRVALTPPRTPSHKSQASFNEDDSFSYAHAPKVEVRDQGTDADLALSLDWSPEQAKESVVKARLISKQEEVDALQKQVVQLLKQLAVFPMLIEQQPRHDYDHKRKELQTCNGIIDALQSTVTHQRMTISRMDEELAALKRSYGVPEEQAPFTRPTGYIGTDNYSVATSLATAEEEESESKSHDKSDSVDGTEKAEQPSTQMGTQLLSPDESAGKDGNRNQEVGDAQLSDSGKDEMDKEGVDKVGMDKEGMDKEGMDKEGMDEEGMDEERSNEKGFEQELIGGEESEEGSRNEDDCFSTSKLSKTKLPLLRSQLLSSSGSQGLTDSGGWSASSPTPSLSSPVPFASPTSRGNPLSKRKGIVTPNMLQ